MYRASFNRMGMLGILGLIGSLKPRAEADGAARAMLNMAMAAYRGGYGNAYHGWSGKRRKVKGWQRPGGSQNRRAERRARA